jgi:hypothetical protein
MPALPTRGIRWPLDSTLTGFEIAFGRCADEERNISDRESGRLVRW